MGVGDQSCQFASGCLDELCVGASAGVAEFDAVSFEVDREIGALEKPGGQQRDLLRAGGVRLAQAVDAVLDRYAAEQPGFRCGQVEIGRVTMRR